MSKFNRGGLPWVLGKDVSNCATAQEVMKTAELDWTVQKCELVSKMPFRIGSNNEVGEDSLFTMVVFIVSVLMLLQLIEQILICHWVLLKISMK